MNISCRDPVELVKNVFLFRPVDSDPIIFDPKPYPILTNLFPHLDAGPAVHCTQMKIRMLCILSFAWLLLGQEAPAVAPERVIALAYPPLLWVEKKERFHGGAHPGRHGRDEFKIR
jgi:hypothetical protein